MAKIIGGFEDGNGPRRYPWRSWTNGMIWEIRRGEDYDVATENMRVNLHERAKYELRELKTKIVRDEGGEGLRFQFGGSRAPRVSPEADDNLKPTVPVQGVPLDIQADSMRLLRRMRRAPEHPHELPDQLVAWASSNSLSRPDMALATELDLEQINEIIRETAERDQNNKARSMQKRSARHIPA